MTAAARVLIAAIALLAGAGAKCATTDGSLLTNAVSATFSANTAGTVAYAVSYNSTATVIVRNPAIELTKVATPTTMSAGGEITFRVWAANTSLYSSAFDVVVIDRLPDNMEYVNPSFGQWVNGTGTWTAEYSSAYGAGYAAGQPGNGQDAPYYLRWTLNWLGPGRSGFIEFKARIL